MNPRDSNNSFPIDMDIKGCELSPAETQAFIDGLSPLTKMVRDFPISGLHLYIERHARTHLFTVKVVLLLCNQSHVTCHEDAHVYTAFERGIDALVAEVQGFKMHLGSAAEQAKQVKGTHHVMVPNQQLSGDQIDQAVQDGDYVAYRIATLPFEDALRMRVGRWINRYPEILARLGKNLTVADLVEAVLLDSFERYTNRPIGMRMGEWLERLMDQTIKALLHHPDDEIDNIRFIQTYEDTETGSAFT